VSENYTRRRKRTRNQQEKKTISRFFRRTQIRSIKNPKTKSKNASEVSNHEMLGGLSMQESEGSPQGREKKI
jgi:hypothetical protein